MSEIIKLYIDGRKVEAEAGSTLLEAARNCGAEVPTICYHEHCSSYGLCRLCVVEVEGQRTLAPACVVEIEEGMDVKTQSDRVVRSRRTILEMLSLIHISEPA